MKLHRHFLPHPETHQKSIFLHWHFLLIYVLLFILLQVSFNLVSFFKPGVLGVNSNITTAKVIEYTNKEREKLGLSPLTENNDLDKAARAKAQNMFEENYWAHFAPSGKDPWGFIQSSGYKFSHAGENLARNFQTDETVVKAWMNSPSHRENIVNTNYQEIGVAVVDGVLLGQKTTLVVQMFGRPYEPLAQIPKVDLGGIKVELPHVDNNQPSLVAGFQTQSTKAVVNPYLISKTAGTILLLFIGTLLIIDMIVLKKRGVFRISSSHIAHLSFLALSGVSLYTLSGGSIL